MLAKRASQAWFRFPLQMNYSAAMTRARHPKAEYRMYRMMYVRTLHGSLRPRRSEQAHASDHEILKRLVTALGPLAHVILEARDPGSRVGLIVLER